MPGQGVRGGLPSTEGPATAFPAGVTLASTWDRGLGRARVARAIGEEARNKGTGSQVVLGPAVNIHRSPLGGRNAEYLSEDPYLNARLAVGYVRGMQGAGVAACHQALRLQQPRVTTASTSTSTWPSGRCARFISPRSRPG